jgi:hydroxylamine reductase
MFIDEGLFATITNANFDRSIFIEYIQTGIKKRDQMKSHVLKKWRENNSASDAPSPDATALPECATWVPANVGEIVARAEGGTGGWLEIENEDIRSLRALILFGLKGISAYMDHAFRIRKNGLEIFDFLMEGLATLVDDTLGTEELAAFVLRTGKMGVLTMALLDAANAEFGAQEVSEVRLGTRNRPGILISGHDFMDLRDLLEQTEGTGIDIYTHSEMLPAHYRPALKKYEHLFANYGNAWHLQKNEIESFNGPVLFTSNCLVPPDLEYKDRIFTSGAVGFYGCLHIAPRSDGGQKDFSPIISMALTCKPPLELEQGTLTGGFGHEQVLKLSDKIIAAVKAGKIKRFIVMAGCDARSKTRTYYTEVAKSLPPDAVILTAGCAKYRFNKLNLGDIDGVPRILDAGQCNDSYSLAVIALELQKAFELNDINDLPISFDIAWYEQKAVLVLLALLNLGIKGIRLGPTLPGFLSPAVATVLMEKFDIKPISTPALDTASMMAGM